MDRGRRSAHERSKFDVLGTYFSLSTEGPGSFDVVVVHHIALDYDIEEFRRRRALTPEALREMPTIVEHPVDQPFAPHPREKVMPTLLPAIELVQRHLLLTPEVTATPALETPGLVRVS